MKKTPDRKLENPKTRRQATSKAEVLERAIVHAGRNLENDAMHENRLAVRECKPCFYWKTSSRIALRAATTFVCQNCGEESEHPNTNVPRYCLTCADRYNACCRCGANL